MSPELSRIGEVGKRAAHGRKWPYAVVGAGLLISKLGSDLLRSRRGAKDAMKHNEQEGHRESRERWRYLTDEDFVDDAASLRNTFSDPAIEAPQEEAIPEALHE